MFDDLPSGPPEIGVLAATVLLMSLFFASFMRE
jgi:hypothetical protein